MGQTTDAICTAQNTVCTAQNNLVLLRAAQVGARKLLAHSLDAVCSNINRYTQRIQSADVLLHDTEQTAVREPRCALLLHCAAVPGRQQPNGF
jgi:hypothetical protein